MRPPDHSHIDEKILLTRICDGDQRAFSFLFEKHYRLVYNVAYNLTKSRVNAKSVVQDVFIKVWCKREDLAEIENFAAFLNRVTRNQTIDALRLIAREARRSVELQAEHVDNESKETELDLQGREMKKLIGQALDSLSPQQKKVYQLCHEHGLKYDEAAVEMGISAGTVHSHMKQALKNIRRYLHGLDILALIILWRQV